MGWRIPYPHCRNISLGMSRHDKAPELNFLSQRGNWAGCREYVRQKFTKKNTDLHHLPYPTVVIEANDHQKPSRSPGIKGRGNSSSFVHVSSNHTKKPLNQIKSNSFLLENDNFN